MATHKGYFRPTNPQKYKGNPSNIVYRSSWELKVMSYFDTHDDIVWWQSEELSIRYFDPGTGKNRRYFPDFLIHTKSGQTTLIEVKPKAQTKPPKKQDKITRKYITEVMTYGKNQAKWNSAEAYCKAKGWSFTIMTEDQIFRNK